MTLPFATGGNNCGEGLA